MQLGERRLLRRRVHVAAHDPAHGSVCEAVADRLVEVLAADATGDPALLHDEDTALTVALTEDHRFADGRIAPDGTRGSGHDVGGTPRLAHGSSERLEHDAPRLVEPASRDR